MLLTAELISDGLFVAVLPMYTMTTFPNLPCTTTTTGTPFTRGTCYSPDDCRRTGGTAGGSCAQGKMSHTLFNGGSWTEVRQCPEAESLDEIPTKVLRVFLLAFQSHLCRVCLRFLFLQTHATSYSFQSAYLTLERRKEENLIENLPRNPYRNLKSENS